jgi:hypothetical protein
LPNAKLFLKKQLEKAKFAAYSTKYRVDMLVSKSLLRNQRAFSFYAHTFPMFYLLSSLIIVAHHACPYPRLQAFLFGGIAMAAFSNYLQNKVLDWMLRGQTFTPPSTVYIGLFTTNDNAANNSGVEVSGGSYARVSVSSALANWAGTQSAGSTTASSGSSGATSNNGVLTFAAPTANWGSIQGIGIFDASTGGNLLFYSPLTTAKTVNNGDPAPTFQAAALSLSIA